MKLNKKDFVEFAAAHIRTVPAGRKTPLLAAGMGVTHAAGRVYVQSIARDGQPFAYGAMDLATARLFAEELVKQIALASQ